jgi:hypothetical protein
MPYGVPAPSLSLSSPKKMVKSSGISLSRRSRSMVVYGVGTAWGLWRFILIGREQGLGKPWFARAWYGSQIFVRVAASYWESLLIMAASASPCIPN